MVYQKHRTHAWMGGDLVISFQFSVFSLWLKRPRVGSSPNFGAPCTDSEYLQLKNHYPLPITIPFPRFA